MAVLPSALPSVHVFILRNQQTRFHYISYLDYTKKLCGEFMVVFR